MSNNKSKYSPEQRHEFVKEVQARYKKGERIADVCKELGFSRGSYDNWMHNRVGTPGGWAAAKKTKKQKTASKPQPVIKQLDLNDLPSVAPQRTSNLTVAIVKGSPDDVRAALSGLLG